MSLCQHELFIVVGLVIDVSGLQFLKIETLADPRRRQECTSWSKIFQFNAVFLENWPNNGLAPPSLDLAPSSGK